MLTSVPESKRKDLDKVSVLTSDPASYEAEAFRSLRTAISFLGTDKDRKAVLFTSANPAEGKAIAPQLRSGSGAHRTSNPPDRCRPSPAQFEQARASGRQSARADRMFTRQAFMVDSCLPAGIENLFILPAGEKASKPAELLASCDFAGLLREALLHFDRIVLDSAPVNAVSDTQLIAKDIQSVVFVVRAVKTPERAIIRACSLLAQTGSHPRRNRL